MKRSRKEISIGFIVAIFATFSGVYLYVELFFKYDLVTTFEMVQDGDLYGQIITLGAVANIFVFFIFLKKKQEARAKGVLMATIVIALFTLYSKFL